jgi:hypothetical protein
MQQDFSPAFSLSQTRGMSDYKQRTVYWNFVTIYHELGLVSRKQSFGGLEVETAHFFETLESLPPWKTQISRPHIKQFYFTNLFVILLFILYQVFNVCWNSLSLYRVTGYNTGLQPAVRFPNMAFTFFLTRPVVWFGKLPMQEEQTFSATDEHARTRARTHTHTI